MRSKIKNSSYSPGNEKVPRDNKDSWDRSKEGGSLTGSQEHQGGLLDEFPDLGKELGCDGAIDDTVVAG